MEPSRLKSPKKVSKEKKATWLELVKVIGVNALDNSGIAFDPITGDISYLNGCFVCVYNPQKDLQTRFL